LNSSIASGERKKSVKVSVPEEEGFCFAVDEINFKSLVISGVHVMLTMPSNFLSYLAEWNTDIFERVEMLKLYDQRYKGPDNEERTIYGDLI
jgi:hypothetical protein